MDFDIPDVRMGTANIRKTRDMTSMMSWYSKRQFARHDVKLEARLSSPAAEFTVRVVNLSGGGACLEIASFILRQVPEAGYDLVIDGFGRFACKTSWLASNRCGVEFLIANTAKTALASQLATDF